MSTVDIDSLIEKLAAIEHERWADWQKWCHKVLREANPSPEIGDILERWDRQIETPYSALTEKEKQSDRDQVARYLPTLKAELLAKMPKPDWDEIKKLYDDKVFEVDYEGVHYAVVPLYSAVMRNKDLLNRHHTEITKIVNEL